jgi:hypothetical protein
VGWRPPAPTAAPPTKTAPTRSNCSERGVQTLATRPRKATRSPISAFGLTLAEPQRRLRCVLDQIRDALTHYDADAAVILTTADVETGRLPGSPAGARPADPPRGRRRARAPIPQPPRRPRRRGRVAGGCRPTRRERRARRSQSRARPRHTLPLPVASSGHSGQPGGRVTSVEEPRLRATHPGSSPKFNRRSAGWVLFWREAGAVNASAWTLFPLRAHDFHGSTSRAAGSSRLLALLMH